MNFRRDVKAVMILQTTVTSFRDAVCAGNATTQEVSDVCGGGGGFLQHGGLSVTLAAFKKKN